MPVRNSMMPSAAAGSFSRGGIRRVMITLGANGSLLAGSEGMEHVPAFSVKSVDRPEPVTHSSAVSLRFLARACRNAEAVKRANLYAGLSTTGVGTQKSFYDRARFDAEWNARGKG